VDKGKLVRLVLIPIIIGLVVTLIVRQVLTPSAEAAGDTPQVETAPVVVVASKEPIPAKTRLTEQQLAVKQLPKTLLTGQEFSQVKDVAGQTTAVELAAGEIVLKNRVVPDGKGTLAYRIPKGMRAITIRIDELSGVAGFPEPGDRVDLILILPEKAPVRPNSTARMIYENVEVLGKGPAPSAAAQNNGAVVTNADASKLSSLTLAMTPEQSVEVALAEQLGLIKTILRPALKEGDVGRVIFSDQSYK
jgi:pilus assembly protein CpaB